MPQLEFIHYASQIFWLTVSFVILYLLMARTALPRVREVLQNRQARITNDLNAAESLKKEAEQSEESYNEALDSAKQEAAKLINEAKAEIRSQEKERHAKLDKNFAQQAKEADQRISLLRKDAAEKLLPASVEAAQLIAQKLVGGELDSKQVEAAVLKAREANA